MNPPRAPDPSQKPADLPTDPAGRTMLVEMPLLIDTYNVLHTTGVLPAEHAGIEVDDLIALLAASRYRRHRCTLVCDGTGMSQHVSTTQGDMRVLYSGPTRTADDVMIDMLNADTAPRLLTVVSSDVAILKAARKRRCPLMRSTTLLAHLAHDVDLPMRPRTARKRNTDPLPREEVKQWIHMFDLSDAELELLAADEQQFEIENQPEAEPQTLAAPHPPAQPIDGISADMIDQAEQLWGDKPAAPVRTLNASKPTGDSSDKEVHDATSQASDVRQTRIDDLEDPDVDAIDMQRLLPDVQPMEDNDD